MSFLIFNGSRRPLDNITHSPLLYTTLSKLPTAYMVMARLHTPSIPVINVHTHPKLLQPNITAKHLQPYTHNRSYHTSIYHSYLTNTLSNLTPSRVSNLYHLHTQFNNLSTHIHPKIFNSFQHSQNLIHRPLDVYRELMTPNYRSFVSWITHNTNSNSRHISHLQTQAYGQPNNISLAYDFMREANRTNPHMCIHFYESFHQDHKNEQLYKEYVRALALTDTLTHLPLYPTSTPTTSTTPSTTPAQSATTLSIPTNTLKEPLKVHVIESNRSSFWRFFILISYLLIIVAGLSLMAEGLAQNMQKSFGMSNKKVVPVKDTKTTFTDVKGCEEVKDEVKEIIAYLKDPTHFTRLGAKLPKGMLLSGPPGTGKTLLARAMAGEAKVPFIQASGSDFEEMFVGVGARRIRDLFTEARKHVPCIIFIDELDAVGSARSKRDSNSLRQTLNQLLVELDGFEPNEGIVVICATNFYESLDPALMRPGRLDKIVNVPLPDLNGRYEILKMYGSKYLLSDDVDLKLLARRTSGMTGADLFNILNIAAMKSSSLGDSSVCMSMLEDAFDRVVAGLEQHSPQSDEERMMTAIHEGGHTIVNLLSKSPMKVHKSTIMRRGPALGITWSIPEKELYSQKYEQLLAQLDILMAGKAAEEYIYGKDSVTTGSSNDLQRATSIARSMVMKFGMGMDGTQSPLYVDTKNSDNVSEYYMRKIDMCVSALLDDAYKRAYKIIKENDVKLRRIADCLVLYETLNLNEIKLAMDGKFDEIKKLRKIPEA